MSSKTKKFRSRAAASSSDEEEGGGEATIARPAPMATAKKKAPAAAPAKKASALLSFDDDDEEDEGGGLQTLKSKKKKALSSKKPLRKALEEHLDDRAADEGAPAPASAEGEYSKEKLAALKKSQHFQVSTKAVRETDRTTRVRFEVPEDAVVAGAEGEEEDEEEDAELDRAKVEQLKKEKRRKDALLAGRVPGQEDEESYIPLDGSRRGSPTDGKGKVRKREVGGEGNRATENGTTRTHALNDYTHMRLRTGTPQKLFKTCAQHGIKRFLPDSKQTPPHPLLPHAIHSPQPNPTDALTQLPPPPPPPPTTTL